MPRLRPENNSVKHSYMHRGGTAPLIGETVDAFLAHVRRRLGDAEAIVSIQQDVRLTYMALDERVDQFARGLMALGIGRGDRVGIWSTDNVEWIIVQLATARIGAVLVNVNPAYRTAELEHALSLARVQVLLLIPSFRKSNYVEMVCQVCPEATRCAPGKISSARLPDLRHLIVFDPDRVGGAERPASGFHTWSEVVAGGDAIAADAVAARAASLDPDDPINIQFTSGTTGFPKAVVLTHHNIINNAFFVGEAMHFTEHDRLCVPVPFYHCFGMVVSTLACLTHGATVVIPSAHFEASATLAAIQDERCTAVHGVPIMFIAELERPEFADYDLSSLRTGIMGGAPCPPALLSRVMDEMGCREILIGYGQTESSPVTHLTLPDDSRERRTETVGRNLPHQEMKVVDPETGAVVPVGTQGEVCFRGYHVMRGYFDEPDATRSAIDEAGWLHSGDLGVLDEEGYLRITGRLRDMIIRGGENVYPAEIEHFLREHPKVREVAVFGMPSEKWGEEIAAWIQLHEGVTAVPDEFRTYARERIAHFKVPQYVWIVEDFPMTVTGKIQKFRAREIAAGWLADASDAAEAVVDAVTAASPERTA